MSFWHPILYRIAKTIFEWDHDLAMQGHHTWSWDVQKVLECAAASPEIFEAKSPGPEDLVERTRSALWKIDLQRRHEDMASMSRLDFYRDVMGDTPITAPEPVEYVKWPLQRQQRAVLARLRSGTLRLSIDTGRYRNIDAAHRLCKHKQCDMDTVETASHFLYSCPTYRNIRQTYWWRYLYEHGL